MPNDREERRFAPMTTTELREALQQMLECSSEGNFEDEFPLELAGCEVRTYQDAMVMTSDEGLIVKLGNQEFYITVQLRPT